MSAPYLTYSVLFKSEMIYPEQPVQITMPSGYRSKNNEPAYAPTAIRFNNDTPVDHYLIPGSTPRGGYRRSTFAVCTDTCNIVALSIRAVNMNLVGGIMGSGKKKLVTPTEILNFLVQNPLIDLFGCGDPLLIPGRFYVGNIVSKYARISTRRDVRRGVRRDPIKDGDYPFDDISKEGQETYSQTIKLIAERAPYQKAQKAIDKAGKIKDRSERAAKENEALEDLKKTLKAINPKIDVAKLSTDDVAHEIGRINRDIAGLGASDVSSQLPLPGYEVIPANAPMEQIMFLDEVRPERIGLVIEGMHRKGLRPFMGGHRGHGCGVLYQKFKVSILVDKDRYVDDCTFEIKPFVGVVISEEREGDGNSIMAKCRQAWKDCDKSSFNFEIPALFTKIVEEETGEDEDGEADQ